MAINDKVLLADDDADFVVLLETAFENAGLRGALVSVCDGPGLISYLRGEGRFADRRAFPIPSVILLEVRLPRLSGFEVLRWIRGQAEFRHLPLVILTGTGVDNEDKLARRAGASGYFVKPFEFERLVELAEQIADSYLQGSRQLHHRHS